jgi:hypothetical protein
MRGSARRFSGDAVLLALPRSLAGAFIPVHPDQEGPRPSLELPLSLASYLCTRGEGSP